MQTKKIKIPLFLLSVVLTALGFNTLDQMIIRYKFYNYWRSVPYWALCPFLTIDWWLSYILFGIFPLCLGSICLGFLLREQYERKC